jgi:hypothetical protein
MIYCTRATRNSSICRLLVPATERTTDLIVVLLDTCRLETEPEEENTGLVSPGRVLRRGPAAKQSIGGLMAGDGRPKSTLGVSAVRPVVLPVHAIEPRAITLSPLCAGQ